MPENNIYKELAPWLEGAIETGTEIHAGKWMIAAIGDDGQVLTAYLHCNATDKAIIRHNVQIDIMVDIFKTERERFREILQEDDDE